MGLFDTFMKGATQQLNREMSNAGRDLVRSVVNGAKKGVKEATKQQPVKQYSASNTGELKDVQQRLEEAGMKEKAEALSGQAEEIQARIGAAAMSGDYKQMSSAFKDMIGFAGKAGNAEMQGLSHVADFLSDAEGGNGKLSEFSEQIKQVGAKLEADGQTVQNS